MTFNYNDQVVFNDTDGRVLHGRVLEVRGGSQVLVLYTATSEHGVEAGYARTVHRDRLVHRQDYIELRESILLDNDKESVA